MKRCFILIFLLLMPFTIALEEKLVLRIHQDQNETVMDLRNYLLPTEEYFVNHTDNLQVEIINKILTVKRIKQEGVGTAIVAIKKTLLEEPEKEEITTEKIFNITKVIEEYPEIISYTEKQQTFNTTINYLPLLDQIERKSIEKIHTQILNDKFYLSVNDEVNFNINYNNQTDKFNYELDIETPKGILDEKALRFNINKYILIIFIILTIAVMIFGLYQLYHQFNLFQTKKPKEKIRISKKEKIPSTMSKLERFFTNNLDIAQSSSLLELEQKLRKKRIKGNKKQEILFLFNKLREGNLSEHEAGLVKRYLRRVQKKL